MKSRSKNLPLLGSLALAWSLFSFAAWPALAATGGLLELNVVDHDTGLPVPCRMHLKNQKGKSQKPPKVPFWHDHFVVDGNLKLKLPNGNYTFVVERGLEYLTVTGHFEIRDNSQDSKTIELKRFADLAKEGWWSGDLEIEREQKSIELLMLADDLHVGEQVIWGNPGGKMQAGGVEIPEGNLLFSFADQRFWRSEAGVISQAGSSLLFLGMDDPPQPPEALANDSIDELVALARKQAKPWIDVRRAASWNLPVWIAEGSIDSIELADSQLARDQTKLDATGMRLPEGAKTLTAAGLGHWTETIYYNLLDCGLRIPPTAASGSGVAPNPVGYNRVYVHVDGPLSYERWFENLRAGQVVVTNGPLIRPNVGGELPGYVFKADAGERVELEVGLTLATRDPISYLEIVKDGRAVQQVRLDEWTKAGGKLPPLKFNESGWFLVRAVTDVATTHRFASTGPYYVEIGYEPRISRAAVQFFLDWLDEIEKRPAEKDAEQKAGPDVARARTFWQDRLSKANAD